MKGTAPTTLAIGVFFAASALAGVPIGPVSPAPPAPVAPSALVAEMLGEWMPQFEAASALPGEFPRAQGEVAGTEDAVAFLDLHSQWMTDFGAKVRAEQSMLVFEQEVVVFVLLGTDPTSDTYQYWRGYEDVIQRTVEAMNSWPDTGGAVPGTLQEYGFFTSSDARSLGVRSPRAQRN